MKTITSVKIDKALKNQASLLAEELGLSLSAVINSSLKKFVIDRGMVLTASPEFNKKTKRELRLIIKDVIAGKNLSKKYSNTKELFDALEI